MEKYTSANQRAVTVFLNDGKVVDKMDYDCRLYLNPRPYPIRLVVKAGAEPYRGERLLIELRTIEGAHKVSEGYTDQQGVAYLSVDSPYWIAFPASASMRVFRGEKELARGVIEGRRIEAGNRYFLWRDKSIHCTASEGRMECADGIVFASVLTLVMPLFYIMPGLLAAKLFPHLGKGDLAFPTLVKNLLPTGLIGLVMAGLVAAIMSHISGSINSCRHSGHPALTSTGGDLAGIALHEPHRDCVLDLCNDCDRRQPVHQAEVG